MTGGASVAELLEALADVERRADAAQAMARKLGAEDALFLVRDRDIGVLLPAPGFPQTLPGGAEWDALLHQCEAPGVHRGYVPHFSAPQRLPALAVTVGAAVFVILGGTDIDPAHVQSLPLRLIAALLDSEQQVRSAQGEARAAQEAARHAQALAMALDGARSELERTIRSFRQSERDRERLVGIVGHDLRNPLQAISMSSSLLLARGALTPQQEKLARQIRSSSDRMARMIRDLLDFERTRGNGVPLDKRPSRLSDFARQAVEELELSHPLRRIRFTVHDDGVGHWDGDRLAQVISNLVGNALQHSPEDSAVDVELRRERDSLVLEVKNQNLGDPMTPDDLARIFEPFRRGKNSLGLGLGLYIVDQVVRAHEGRVTVTSTREGTAFCVELPAARAAA